MANKFDIDPDLVKKLAELLDETGLSEIEFESTGRRIRVARPVAGSAPPITVNAPPAAAAAAPSADAESQSEARIGTPITSPMVGTIFLSPEPGAEPFIKVGDTVSEGQTVMLIEAMKTYNPVRATKSGKVVQILVGDSTPVEFGEELLLVE
jgi:acetyl-CoA carboxylase biotin carboxyl carrier protein